MGQKIGKAENSIISALIPRLKYKLREQKT